MVSTTCSAQRHARGPRTFDDADPAHFELARERFGRAAPEAVALEPDVAAIVGDELCAAIDQPQREVRLALSRIAEDQHAAVARRDAAGVDIDDFGSGPAGKHGAWLTGDDAVLQGDRTKASGCLVPAIARGQGDE